MPVFYSVGMIVSRAFIPERLADFTPPMNYQARKIRLTCDESVVRDWAKFMLAHPEDVSAALRKEGVRHEMWFLGTDDISLFVIGVMDVDDAAASAAESKASGLAVDAVHRRFKTHWDRSGMEDLKIDPTHPPAFEGCELLFEAHAG